MSIAALDWIFAVVLLASLVIGAWRGLIFELLSVLSWIAAFFLAQWLAADVSQLLPMSGAGETVQYAAGFAVVFVLAVLAGGLLAALAKRIFLLAGLQPADRALGAVFGLIRGVFLLLATTVVVGMTPLKSDQWWRDSVGVGVTTAALRGLKPVVPQDFGRYLPL